MVSTERLITIILDALPAEKYLTIKIQATKDPDLSSDEIESMIKSIYQPFGKIVSYQKESEVGS